MKVIYAGATDVGQVREHNEDNFLILPDRNLIAVCDGMGGHAAGEVASQIAVDTISSLMTKPEFDLFTNAGLTYPEALTDEGKLLVGAIAIANQRIIERGKKTPGQTGMGTTVIACQFRDGVVSICHVGDSRAYLIRGNNIRRVTIDHSWVSEVMEKHNLSEEESENLVNKNVITRALGTKQAIRTDISQIRFVKGDLFLLCSDGLTGMVSDSDILKAAQVNGNNLDQLVLDLIRLANDSGGMDNITACVAKVMEQEEIEDFDELRRITVDWERDEDIDKVQSIAGAKFPGETIPPAESSAEATGFQTLDTQKKNVSNKSLNLKTLNSKILLTTLFLAIAVFIIIWYFQSS